MSTPSLTAPGPGGTNAGGAAGYRVTYPRVLRAEWSKLWSLRSTWYALAAVVVLAAGIGLAVGATYRDGRDHGPQDPVETTLLGLNFGLLILPVLGILTAAGEWSTGTVRATMAAVPRRLPVLAAKAAVFGAVSFVLTLATALSAFPLAQAFLAGTDIAAGLGAPGVARALVTTAAGAALIAVLGVAVGALLRGIPASIGVFVAVLMVVPSVAPLLPYDWVEDAVAYTPLAAMDPLMSADPSPDMPSPGAALVTLAVWAAGALAAAGVRLRRSDV
ncbi:ABC transporter permease [Streptomyces sp. CMB-StM0423]|uniref:ABC transporter permease n=1 Tax=Streptomyces sp. CMB-StM0423 TaxID=2059884 RepID=UPI000C703C37|nr:ABC transporter permease [Streptomyces sp. CMB-StM0423]AUH43589.1 ABC transporter permease [Streptomyces sp. CMB-StM0423]